MAKTPAWQRKEGKNPSGGLNAKGRASYTKDTLKAPTKSKTSGRRKSFCARMGGMKKRLTSAKTARDPDSRINKALRKWDCQMAKIVVKVPEPKEEYDFSNQKQISRALTAIIEQLNSTFLQQQKEDQERFTWYLS